jgi:hypothetical protein
MWLLPRWDSQKRGFNDKRRPKPAPINEFLGWRVVCAAGIYGRDVTNGTEELDIFY